MTRAEAQSLVQKFLASIELGGPGLNDSGLGGVVVNGTGLFFEYQAAQARLQCNALLYTFRQLPMPEMIKSFVEEAQHTDPGGGTVEYQPENRGVFLARQFTSSPSDEDFREAMARLMGASVRWRHEAIEGIAVRGHAKMQGLEGKAPVSFFPEKGGKPKSS